MQKTILWVLGAVFTLVGVLGFISNPIVGASGLFQTNLLHDLVHLITGLVFLGIAFKAEDKAGLALKVFGIVYLVVAVLGFLMVPQGGALLGLIQTNMADHWLHLVLGVVILGLAFWGGKGTSKPMMQTGAPMGGMN